MSIGYEGLREIALEIPEVKRLLKERRQIEQDGQKKGAYTKPSPRLTPSNDKYHSKKHKLDKSKDLAVKKIIQDKLKENAKKIEKAIYANFDKDKEKEQIKGYKEFKSDELVAFIEKGREQVLKDRTKEIRQGKKEPEKEIDTTQERFDKKIENSKDPNFDRLQDAFDKIKREYEQNKNEIQQDRGFSR